MAEPSPTVAITRSVEDNRSLAARLEALGFQVVEVPLIEVASPSDDGRALAAALDDLAAYDWVVVTSANGVRALARAIGTDVDERRWPDGVAIAAVGPTTAHVAEAAGLPVALVPEVATAAALADAFPIRLPDDGGRVLAPLAELAGDTIVDRLGAKGWQVERVEAYRTRAPAERPAVNDVDLAAATFFSPSAVDRWVDRFGSGAPLAVCIGPSTTNRATERGFSRVVTADPHTEDGMVATLENLVAGRPLPCRRDLPPTSHASPAPHPDHPPPGGRDQPDGR